MMPFKLCSEFLRLEVLRCRLDSDNDLFILFSESLLSCRFCFLILRIYDSFFSISSSLVDIYKFSLFFMLFNSDSRQLLWLVILLIVWVLLSFFFLSSSSFFYKTSIACCRLYIFCLIWVSDTLCPSEYFFSSSLLYFYSWSNFSSKLYFNTVILSYYTYLFLISFLKCYYSDEVSWEIQFWSLKIFYLRLSFYIFRLESQYQYLCRIYSSLFFSLSIIYLWLSTIIFCQSQFLQDCDSLSFHLSISLFLYLIVLLWRSVCELKRALKFAREASALALLTSSSNSLILTLISFIVSLDSSCLLLNILICV